MNLKKLLLISNMVFAMLIGFMPQANAETATTQGAGKLEVIVIYHYPSNPSWDEGVGEGVFITLTRNGEVVDFGTTNLASAQIFTVPHGTYEIEAFPKGFGPLQWECKEDHFFFKPESTMVLECEKRFRLSIPILNTP